MTVSPKAALLAVLIAAVTGLMSGCGTDPTAEIDAATSSALDTS
jgi:hypothetical protein